MFKKGDVVKWNGPSTEDTVFGSLTHGSNYIVWAVHSSDNTVEVEDVGKRWHSDQFILMSRSPSALDIQHGGNHYKGLKIQPVEYIMANGIGYMEGNAIKYITRYKLKNGTEDLKKARHYIEMLIENEEKNNAESKAK